jgi:hypothetical protein
MFRDPWICNPLLNTQVTQHGILYGQQVVNWEERCEHSCVTFKFSLGIYSEEHKIKAVTSAQFIWPRKFIRTFRWSLYLLPLLSSRMWVKLRPLGRRRNGLQFLTSYVIKYCYNWYVPRDVAPAVWKRRVFYVTRYTKAKDVPLYATEVLRRKEVYSPYSFSTSALDGVSC